jgi:hypothetical protein
MLAIVSVTFVLAPYLVIIALYGPVTSGTRLVVAAAAGLALSVSVVLRRHFPMIFMLLTLLFVAVHVVFVPLPFSMLVAVPAAVHAVSRYIRQGVIWTLFIWIPAAIGCVARWYFAYSDQNDDGSLLRVAAFGLLAFIGIILTAYAVGRRGYDLAGQRDREVGEAVELARSEAVGQLEEVYAGDVAAQAEWVGQLQHAFDEVLTTMVGHVDQAKYLLPTQPGQADAALDRALDAGHGALADLQRMMGAAAESEAAAAESAAAAADSADEYDDYGYDDAAAPEFADDGYDDGYADDAYDDEYGAPYDDEYQAGYDDGYDTAPGDEAYGDASYDDASYGDSHDDGPYDDEYLVPGFAEADYPADAYADDGFTADDYPGDDYSEDGYAYTPAAPPPPPEVWDSGIPYLPNPSINDVPRLVRSAGARLIVAGKRKKVDDVLGVTIYRIIEESLTNVLKHAGPDANPKVYVDWGKDDVELSVTNERTDFVPAEPDRDGEGLDTMAERAEAVGGVLETGPTAEGGFNVWASLPYRWQAAPPAPAPALPAPAGRRPALPAAPAPAPAWDVSAPAYAPADQNQWAADPAGWAQGDWDPAEWPAAPAWQDQAPGWDASGWAADPAYAQPEWGQDGAWVGDQGVYDPDTYWSAEGWAQPGR